MFDSPLLVLGAFGVAAYLFHLWWADYRAECRGTPNRGAFPGATPVGLVWAVIAVVGSLLLVALETGGEYALGVVSEQSTLPAIALLSLIAAGFGEELVFRGYVFYDRRGPRVLWLSIFAASAVFALFHYQYYTVETEDGGRELLLNTKAAWSLGLLFLNSLWFYYLRFSSHNPTRSLIPCILAHLASNLAIYVIKAFQGFVTWGSAA